jgi:hypothetical protein
LHHKQFADLQERDRRHAAHVEALSVQHERAVGELREYHRGITQSNLALIKTLKVRVGG